MGISHTCYSLLFCYDIFSFNNGNIRGIIWKGKWWEIQANSTNNTHVAVIIPVLQEISWTGSDSHAMPTLVAFYPDLRCLLHGFNRTLLLKLPCSLELGWLPSYVVDSLSEFVDQITMLDSSSGCCCCCCCLTSHIVHHCYTVVQIDFEKKHHDIFFDTTVYCLLMKYVAVVYYMFRSFTSGFGQNAIQ